MNSNLQASYQGLLNRNIGTNITCDAMNATTISSSTLNVNSITASHYYGIICQTLNTSSVNPEITIGFDPTINTITLQLFDMSIPLTRLSLSMYSSTATPSTLVFRDSYNSTTMDTLIVSNVLSATANALSTVSRSNTLSMTTTSLNQSYFLPLLDTMTSGYKLLYVDSDNGLYYNPSTNTLTTSSFISTVSSLFTNGSSVQGVTYSAIFGLASSTKSGQIALIDGGTYNSYTQLYCRSRNLEFKVI